MAGGDRADARSGRRASTLPPTARSSSSASAMPRCRTGRGRSRWTARRSFRSACSATVRDRLARRRAARAPAARRRRLDPLRERQRRARAAASRCRIRWRRRFAAIVRDADGDPAADRRRLSRSRERVRRRSRRALRVPRGRAQARDRAVRRRRAGHAAHHLRVRIARGTRSTEPPTAIRSSAFASELFTTCRSRSNLHPDRLFPADPATRELARRLYATVKDLPIVSPHGHTDPQWFADDTPFANASALFITPDHYVFRMLYSQGMRLEDLGIPRRDGGAGRDRRAQDLAHVRRALSPVPRHADAHVARPRVPHDIRHRASA